MNLRQLEVFQAVLQTGNMSAAARLLCITPSAVSKAVAHTELQLGYRLFNRSPAGLTPTPEAQVLATESTGIWTPSNALRATWRPVIRAMCGWAPSLPLPTSFCRACCSTTPSSIRRWVWRCAPSTRTR